MKLKKKYLFSILIFIIFAVMILFLSKDSIENSQSLPMEKTIPDSTNITKSHVANQIVDEMPQFTNRKLPKYPNKGLSDKMECIVYVRVKVDTGGNPIKTEIMKREGGLKEFEDSVIVAVMHSKFTPAKTKGISVEAWVVIPYKFRLQ